MTWTLQTLTPFQADEERDQIATDEEHVLALPGARLTFGTRDGMPVALIETAGLAIFAAAAQTLEG